MRSAVADARVLSCHWCALGAGASPPSAGSPCGRLRGIAQHLSLTPFAVRVNFASFCNLSLNVRVKLALFCSLSLNFRVKLASFCNLSLTSFFHNWGIDMARDSKEAERVCGRFSLVSFIFPLAPPRPETTCILGIFSEIFNRLVLNNVSHGFR